MVKLVETAEAWEEEMAGANAILVDFYADWCGPCRKIAPKLEEFAKKYTNVVFLKVNVEEECLEEVVKKAGVSAMPTFQVYKNGVKVDELVGADANKLEAMIGKHN